MKQIVIPKAGKPEVLQLVEKANPQPKEGEVLIEVKATGINFADILARQGLYPDAPAKPCVVGYEVAGNVIEVGEGVGKDWIGKPVLALTKFGGYSSHICTPVIHVFEKPEQLSYEQSAAIPCVYTTAWGLLVVMGALQKEDTVLIHNAGSSVGLAALQIAKHIGAITIGTASGHKHEFLKDFGFDHLIDYRTEDWLSEVKNITNGKGVELAIDPIGGKNWKLSFKALRHTGRLGMFGMGSISASGLKGKINLIKALFQTPRFSPFSLLARNKSIFGLNMGHLWHEKEKVRNWTEQIIKGVEEGWIQPHIDKTFPLEAAAEAHQYIEDRKSKGKVLLIP